MNKKINTPLGIILLIVLAIAACYFMLSFKETVSITLPVFPGFPYISLPEIFRPRAEAVNFKRFTSEEDFKDYLEESELGLGAMGWGGGEMTRLSVPAPMPAPPGLEEALGKGGEAERVSTTTVQVAGIDEPDIVKTDGQEIYFSQEYGWPGPIFMERGIYPPPSSENKTRAIKAFPPGDLAEEGEIDKTGNLLLKDNVLVIFSWDKIYGYDVSDPKSPQKKWTMEMGDNNYLVGARLYRGRVYLITSTRVSPYRPCPIRPLIIEGLPLEVKCIDIYHPVVNVPVDVTYTAMVVNPDSGKVEKNISFVGSSSSSIIYMSEGNLYLTYSYQGDFIEFFYNFFRERCRDIVPNWLIQDLAELVKYDISDAAKMTEFQVVWQQYSSSLESDERLRVENELTNRMQDYYKDHKRDLEKTGIAKIGLDNFDVLATGEVPGAPLNQFSLDEYQSYLRIATTVSEGFWFWGFGSAGESANDVYVLDKNLKTVGSVKDLGLEERIYSVRFIEDKGYLVTFRQIDPFFVLDLSDPKNPELKGELKIPGYSSYLHPITKDKILGIGKEGSKVKISLFDVASPENPAETAKYTLDEYWSDILNTHHAFLLDKKHQIFFLPGSRGGYVFSYKDFQLELIRAVSDIRARRAVYIDDYLYIIGDDEIVVLNEIDWEEVNSLEL